MMRTIAEVKFNFRFDNLGNVKYDKWTVGDMGVISIEYEEFKNDRPIVIVKFEDGKLQEIHNIAVINWVPYDCCIKKIGELSLEKEV